MSFRCRRTMAAFCSAVNFLRVLVIGILQETAYVSLIRGNSTFKRGKTKALLIAIRDEPSLFVNIVRFTSVDDDGQSTDAQDELVRIRVTQVRRLLCRLAELPGQSELCPIEGRTFIDWVSEVLQIALEYRCLNAIGRQIIDIITSVSWRSIETWPDEELVKVINHMDGIFPEILQRRLSMGLSQARGFHCCDPTGKSENSLSAKISDRAAQIRSRCPAASRALRVIANELRAEAKGNVEESNRER